jgi:hypothetical protein
MVIECIGLPGSGKGELMKLVGKELERREVDYINVSFIMKHNIIWKLMGAAAGALIYLSSDARWLRDRLREILRGEGGSPSRFGISADPERLIRAIAVYAFWYRRFIRSHKLYLFDEGMVHLITLFAADHEISDETFRKIVVASERGIRKARLVILNKVPVEEALLFMDTGEGSEKIFGKAEGEDRAELFREWDRFTEVYKSCFRALEVQSGEEKRKKMSRVFGRIRQILSETDI